MWPIKEKENRQWPNVRKRRYGSLIKINPSGPDMGEVKFECLMLL